MKELYFSLDIEADGPIPGPHSMLSYGIAAFDRENETPVASHDMNLVLLPGASPHEGTMEFWNASNQNRAAYSATREDTVSPDNALRITNHWIERVCEENGGAKPVCVAYPASFDFMFLYWYFMNFMGSCPFGFQALDIKTLGMVAMDNFKGFKRATKANFPRHWFPEDAPHTHHALDDAIEQGILFVRILKDVCPSDELLRTLGGALMPG